MSGYDAWKTQTPPEYADGPDPDDTPAVPKLRHIVQTSHYCASTERNEVTAYCGYSEEASGSGRHTVDVGQKACEECLRREKLDVDTGRND